MYIHVKLLNGFPKQFTYKVPAHWDHTQLVGAIVQVPLKERVVPALVTDIAPAAPAPFAIREALALQPFPADAQYHAFLRQLSTYYQVHPVHFIKRIAQFITQTEISLEQEMPMYAEPNNTGDVQLTEEQQTVVNFIEPLITNQHYTPTVLHGVTGSGKTEVYKQLITHTLAQHKSIILLLPEVTLALQFESLLQKQLPQHIPIISFHSGTALKTKKLLWQQLLEKKPMLIIGVHMPILLPISNLGCIIVDEEHEIGYQEKKHPKINSKEAALIRAKLTNIPILLGSATPSIATLYQVKNKGWHFFQLKKRFKGTFPTIQTVFLKDHKERRNFWITLPLQRAITDRLLKKEQSIIFLNRRGFSFFVQCKACSFIFECASCSVSLTLHEQNRLHCHYCSYTMTLPALCPSCKKTDQFLKKGIGTQQVVAILEKLFPAARIGRADMDISSKKKIWKQTLVQFEQGELDILVGTQTITKGFHFPKVTLVGILWADLNLHFPIYNAAETTLQQLIQVAGRAGRASAESLVIVQTMIDHPIFHYLNEVDYLQFYEKEQQTRTLVGYPPAMRFAEIELKHTNEICIEKEAGAVTDHLMQYCATHTFDIQVLGPAKPPVHKIKNLLARKIYLKGADINTLITLYRSIDHAIYKSSIFFTPNPSN